MSCLRKLQTGGNNYQSHLDHRNTYRLLFPWFRWFHARRWLCPVWMRQMSLRAASWFSGRTRSLPVWRCPNQINEIFLLKIAFRVVLERGWLSPAFEKILILEWISCLAWHKLFICAISWGSFDLSTRTIEATRPGNFGHVFWSNTRDHEIHGDWVAVRNCVGGQAFNLRLASQMEIWTGIAFEKSPYNRLTLTNRGKR